MSTAQKSLLKSVRVPQRWRFPTMSSQSHQDRHANASWPFTQSHLRSGDVYDKWSTQFYLRLFLAVLLPTSAMLVIKRIFEFSTPSTRLVVETLPLYCHIHIFFFNQPVLSLFTFRFSPIVFKWLTSERVSPMISGRHKIL